jgi:Papain-like cysteine protease AvrRpt2
MPQEPMSIAPFNKASCVTRREAQGLMAAAALTSWTRRTLAVPNRRVVYDVPLIAQQTALSCWAAAIAMIVSWARREPESA